MKNFSKIFFLTLVFPLLFGCAQTKTQIPNAQKTVSVAPTPKTTVTVKKENDLFAENKYKFCEDKGYQVVIKFNPQTNSSTPYCQFPTGECELEKFINNACNEQTAKKQVSETIEITNCNKTENKPVCGKDNQTYQNSCIARMQKIEILHEEACANAVEDDKTPVISNAESKTADNKLPDWITILTDVILSNSKSNPPATIQKCASPDTYYLESSGGDKHYTTLYNINGQLVCYPSNDLTMKCPNLGNCKTIWTDTR